MQNTPETDNDNSKCWSLYKPSLSLTILMRFTASLALTVLFCGGTVLPPRTGPIPISKTKLICKTARTASTRLICAEPDLTAIDAILSVAYRGAKAAAAPGAKWSLIQQQSNWIRDRDQKCGLTGRNFQPIRELLPAKQCLESAIEARISDLEYGPETGSISQAPPPPPPPTISVTPVLQSPILRADGVPASNEPPPFKELHFSSSADGIDGAIKCSSLLKQGGSDPVSAAMQGKSFVKIAIDGSPTSYRMFENDAWEPFLDNLRSAAQLACTNALKTGRLRDDGNEIVAEVNDVFEVSSPQGLFTAYSIGPNTPWVLETNLPRARKQLKAALGIDTWVEPSQLAKNPYFFKNSSVGMVVRFDHMLSSNDAVFSRSGSEIFVSGVPSATFQSNELVVLAGRVMGNKGVIGPLGNESLLPSLNYIGARPCDNSCDGL